MINGLIVLFFILSVAVFAQEQDNSFSDIDLNNPTVSTTPVQNPQNTSSTSSPTKAVQSSNTNINQTTNNLTKSLNYDYFPAGWNAKKNRHEFGFSPLINLIQYEYWISQQWGFFAGFRYSKNTDSVLETKTSTFNQSTLQMIETTAFSGSRNPVNYSLAAGIKNRIWQNEWMQINWGFLMLYSAGTSTSYKTGSISRTTTNTNTPDDYSVVETNLGTVNEAVDPTYTYGFKFGSEFYVRWFPNLSLCADVMILNSLPLKGTTETSTASRSYSVTAGIQQSPTAETYTNTRVYKDFGAQASTTQVGAQYFSAFQTNWSIKYMW